MSCAVCVRAVMGVLCAPCVPCVPCVCAVCAVCTACVVCVVCVCLRNVVAALVGIQARAPTGPKPQPMFDFPVSHHSPPRPSFLPRGAGQRTHVLHQHPLGSVGWGGAAVAGRLCPHRHRQRLCPGLPRPLLPLSGGLGNGGSCPCAAFFPDPPTPSFYFEIGSAVDWFVWP